MLGKLFILILAISIRTPKETNPLDYLFDIEIQKPDTVLVRYSFERELGEYYTSKEYMIAWNYKNFRIKEYYIKDFKNRYNQIDIQYKQKWLSAGYAYRDGSKLIIAINLRNEKSYLKFESVTDFLVTSYNVKAGSDWKIRDNISYMNEIRYIRTNVDYFQFKVGIKVKL